LVTQPAVSLGLPVYNGERYLSSALAALLNQEFEDFELIICDNASTDRTEEICLSYASKDSRIRYFRNATNIGLAANHNRTFELSQGALFKWVAHDDDFPRAMLRRMVDVFANAPRSVSLVYSRCEYIDELGNVQEVDSDGVDKEDPWPHRRLAHFLRHVHMYNSVYGMIRADVLRRTRLHGLFPMSDHVLLAELAMLGTFLEITEPLLRIRRHPGRTFTANKTPIALRDLFSPGQTQRAPLISIKTRVQLELVRSATRVPTNRRDKMLCTAVAIAKPQLETFRSFVGRYRRKLLRTHSQLSDKRS